MRRGRSLQSCGLRGQGPQLGATGGSRTTPRDARRAGGLAGGGAAKAGELAHAHQFLLHRGIQRASCKRKVKPHKIALLCSYLWLWAHAGHDAPLRAQRSAGIHSPG